MYRLVCIVAIFITCAIVSAEQPNILFIYTDDQAAWALGSVNPDFYTPNLDRLFAQGAVLSNAFVTTPVCSPSRVGLLTSRYGSEVGITDWINPRGGEHQRKEDDLGLDPSLPTWVRQLRDAGYATALVGKWHLGTQDRFHPSRFGYERFIGFRAGGNKVESPELEVDGEQRVVPGLTTDVLTDFAIEVLRGVAENGPFLLSLHYRAPHAPWTPVADVDNVPYAGRELTLPNPDVPDLDVERVARIMREYAASMTGVDRNVGRVLGVLEELGLAQNTIIVFTSDHGYNIGHHGLLHKGNGGWITTDKRDIPFHDPRVTRPNMFDTSLRVPAVVVWPGKIEAGTTVDEVVTNLDWYPTLLALAGIEPPASATIHGRDFSPLLRGEDVSWENTFYGEYAQHHYTEADLRMWRTPEWKLVRDFLRPGYDELYHLAEDPGETRNLVADAEFAEELAELDAEMQSAVGELAQYTPSLSHRSAETADESPGLSGVDSVQKGASDVTKSDGTTTRPDPHTVAARAVILKYQIVLSKMYPPPDVLKPLLDSWSTELQSKFKAEFRAHRAKVVRDLKDAGIWSLTTADERRYLNTEVSELTTQMVVDASWLMESAECLLWALGYLDEIPPYDYQAEMDHLKLLPSLEDLSWLTGAQMRSPDEIEKERSKAELWHWRSRTRELTERGQPVELPDGLTLDEVVRMAAEGAASEGWFEEPMGDDFPLLGKPYRQLTAGEWMQARSVAMERHRALNWLCGYAPKNQWDKTPTDT